MDQRIFHGSLTPDHLAAELIGAFNRGNWRAQRFGSNDSVVVQIATREQARSGGQTALSVSIQKVEDGVAVQIGEQSWLGVAASLGQSLLSAWRSPWYLVDRLDDLAQDFENLQLQDLVWKTIERAARAAGASQELSERFRRLTCAYCWTANPVGEASCMACGAPLGKEQPRTCRYCGFLLTSTETVCPNCRKKQP